MLCLVHYHSLLLSHNNKLNYRLVVTSKSALTCTKKAIMTIKGHVHCKKWNNKPWQPVLLQSDWTTGTFDRFIKTSTELRVYFIKSSSFKDQHNPCCPLSICQGHKAKHCSQKEKTLCMLLFHLLGVTKMFKNEMQPQEAGNICINRISTVALKCKLLKHYISESKGFFFQKPKMWQNHYISDDKSNFQKSESLKKKWNKHIGNGRKRLWDTTDWMMMFEF